MSTGIKAYQSPAGGIFFVSGSCVRYLHKGKPEFSSDQIIKAISLSQVKEGSAKLIYTNVRMKGL